MNKYTKMFKISFIFYILVLLVSDYITARLWADFILYLFILSVIYQLVYIFYLCKKENKKVLNSLGMYFLYAISSVSIFMLIDCVKSFIFGYTPSFIGISSGTTYYGFEALTESISMFIYIPWFILNIIIIIIYCFINRKRSL